MKESSPVGGLGERKRPSAWGDFGLALWSETGLLARAGRFACEAPVPGV